LKAWKKPESIALTDLKCIKKLKTLKNSFKDGKGKLSVLQRIKKKI